MNTKVIAIALFIAGVVLLVMGLQASESFTSEVSEMVTGTPTDRAMWLIIGGVVLAVVGGGTMLFGRRR